MSKQKVYIAIFLLTFVSVLFSSFKNDEKSFVKTELYFGLSRNDSGYITEEEWQAFEDTVITLAFPNGSTTHDTKGKWRNEYGTVISEKSKMVALINEMTPDISAQIDSVREKYKRHHNQTAVLRVDHKVEISF